MINVFATIFKILDKESKKKFFLLIILLFISGALSLLGVGAVIPFVSVLLSPDKNWLQNVLTVQQQAYILPVSIFIMIIAFWLKNIVSYYCVKVQTKILYGIAYKVSRQLFQRYMNVPYIWYLSQNTSELIRNVMNECYVFANGILAPLGSFSTELVTSLFIFLFLLYLNVKFTLIVSCSLLICMFLYTYLTRSKVNFYAKKRAIAWTLMTKDVMQGINGIKETKIYNLEQHFILSFNKHAFISANCVAFSGYYSQAPRFALEAVAITVVMLAIGFIWFKGHNNGEVLMLLSIFGVSAMQLLPSLNRLMTSIAAIKYSLPALKTIEEGLNNNQNLKISNEDQEKNLIFSFNKEVSLEKISFSYPDGTKALENVSLTIKKGQSIAFIGYSGAGKTSLADIILGLNKIESGRILIDGQELNDNNIKLWRKHLGYIPQFIYLYDCSIKENVAFGIPSEEIKEDKVWEALDIASMKDYVRNLPEGINTQIGENGIRLSGGQRQRIGIARALFRNPSVLILDEATASLDNQTEMEVTQAIQKAAKNRTVITIAHRISTVRNSDVIFVMKNGSVIASGSYNELLDDCKLFKNLVQIEELVN